MELNGLPRKGVERTVIALMGLIITKKSWEYEKRPFEGKSFVHKKLFLK